jgi:hypothetical protein
MLVNSMKEKVNLDDAQVAAVQRVYQDQHEGFDKVNKNYQELIDKAHGESARERDRIHQGALAQIKALLRPEQVPLYEKWRADLAARDAERKKQKKQQHDRDGRPDGRQFPPPPRP